MAHVVGDGGDVAAVDTDELGANAGKATLVLTELSTCRHRGCNRVKRHKRLSKTAILRSSG